MKHTKVSIVVIGFNEARNLHNTFQAINNMNYPKDDYELIYVDSGSEDGSIEIAKLYTEKVFIENIFPSSGRNRNRGLVEAKYEIVHFIDGDVIIDPDYLNNILPIFDEKNVHAIVGQLDEQHPNLYNKVASLSNSEKKEGYIKATSTGATYLKEALMSVNGYDERIKRGQETELGERFRAAGFKIWCTNYKMGSHNFDIQSFSGILKKAYIKGKSVMQIYFMNGEGSFFISNKKRVNKLFLRHSIIFFILILAIISHNFLLFLIFYLIYFLYTIRKTFFDYKINTKIRIVAILARFVSQYVYLTGMLIELFEIFFKGKSNKVFVLEKDILKNNFTLELRND